MLVDVLKPLGFEVVEAENGWQLTQQIDEIISRLRAKDIFVNVSYQWPIHTMPGYSYIGYKSGDLPETERAANEIFSLPMYPSLTDDEQEIVIDELRKILDTPA